jgi:glucuronate isomerase
MRANGVPEQLITGDAEPYAKFLAWARTVPQTLRNPLYHWTHLELERYFQMHDLLDASTAKNMWNRASEMLAEKDLHAQGILAKFNVTALCTTDDPADDLACHQAIAASGLVTRVLPAYRPDKALTVHKPEVFNPWIDRLAAASNIDIDGFQSFTDALRQRHDYFHTMGARLSDHGLNHCYANFASAATASVIFDRARKGQAASPEEHEQFASHLMLLFGHLDAEKAGPNSFTSGRTAPRARAHSPKSAPTQDSIRSATGTRSTHSARISTSSIRKTRCRKPSSTT